MKTDPNSLHDALVELATTMSPNPDRLRQVRQRVGQDAVFRARAPVPAPCSDRLMADDYPLLLFSSLALGRGFS